MAVVKDWFAVDKEGLGKLLGRRGKEFVVYEMVQNSWDTEAKNVTICLYPCRDRKGYAKLEVTDDHPEGWRDLTHAWTLYAESEKKNDPRKRGRFNLGEKLVLALCKEARIETTKGGVVFDEEGRHILRTKRDSGSRFEAIMKMTAHECEEVEKAVERLMAPTLCRTTFNGKPLRFRLPHRTIEVTLPTEIADEEGILRKSARKTEVDVHEVRSGEIGFIYEMGIPIVDIPGDKYSFNIQQKVPLNSDRDNVTPAYLHELRTAVLLELYQEITPSDSTSKWVRDAAEDERVSKEAMTHVITQRFGEKRVIADPSDPEGTKLAVSQGYQVIQPGSLSGDEWANVKRHEVALPAGKVTPSPKPYDPKGDPLQYLDREKWTEGMRRIVAYAADIARELLGSGINIQIASKVTWPYAATYAPGQLVFNLGRLGHAWFDQGPREEVDELLIHEMGHHYSSDHLSEGYHDALCRLGARLGKLALEKPELMKRHGR